MILRDHISIILTSAEVRRDQWQEVANHGDPSEINDELYEAYSADLEKGKTECQDMADTLTQAIDAVQAAMKKGKFYE